MGDSGGSDDKKKFPWDRPESLDSNSSYAPEWFDPSYVMEKIAAEAAQLAEAKTQAPRVEVPLTEKSVESLSFGQKLAALLMTCGASVTDIALELGTTAEVISNLENNRLITEQIEIYRERFFSSDPQSQLKALLPDAVKYVQDVMKDGVIGVDAEKKLDTVKWLIEKITGKAVQAVDVSASLNFSHLLEEMKKMRDVREEMASGNQQALSGSVRDVTPKAEEDKFTQWAREWKQGQQVSK